MVRTFCLIPVLIFLMFVPHDSFGFDHLSHCEGSIVGRSPTDLLIDRVPRLEDLRFSDLVLERLRENSATTRVRAFFEGKDPDFNIFALNFFGRPEHLSAMGESIQGLGLWRIMEVILPNARLHLDANRRKGFRFSDPWEHGNADYVSLSQRLGGMTLSMPLFKVANPLYSSLDSTQLRSDVELRGDSRVLHIYFSSRDRKKGGVSAAEIVEMIERTNAKRPAEIIFLSDNSSFSQSDLRYDPFLRSRFEVVLFSNVTLKTLDRRSKGPL